MDIPHLSAFWAGVGFGGTIVLLGLILIMIDYMHGRRR